MQNVEMYTITMSDHINQMLYNNLIIKTIQDGSSTADITMEVPGWDYFLRHFLEHFLGQFFGTPF